MSRRYLLTFLVTLLVLGVYTGYAELARRILSREHVVRQSRQAPALPSNQPIGPRISHEMALKHLPDAAWTVDSRVKIRADGLHIYFNDRAHENGNTELRVSPVAMVWNAEPAEHAEGTTGEPIVILAESATFQFDQPVELSEIRTSLIRQIVLRGQVRIRGDRELHIVGSNFTFSRASKHLFSDHPIEFRMQEHRGFARNIQLNLEMLDGPAHANNPRILGISDLLIREHLEMHLQPEGSEPVLVTCEDLFHYRVKAQQAMLQGNVLVHRTDAQGLVDDLNCDRLTLQFEELASDTASQPLALTSQQGARMSIRFLLAEGEQVSLKSQANRLAAWGQSLNYDLTSRKLTMRDARAVRVRFDGADLLTPQLEMHLDERNQPVFAHAAGPGQLQYTDTTTGESSPARRNLLVEAQWRDSLVMEPDPEQGASLQRITLTGLARLSTPMHRAGMMAQTLRFWLDKPAEFSLLPAEPGPATGPAARIPAGFRMHRVEATGQVAVASPQLEGVYESLEISFEPGTPEVMARVARQEQGEQDSIQLVGAEQGQQQSARPQLQVDARQLRLKVLHNENFQTIHLAHVESRGELLARGQLPGQEDAIVVSGQGAEIFNEGGEQQRFHLLGAGEQLAWIQNGAVRIDGIDLYVDRGRNQARVHGAGSLQFPVHTDWEGTPLGQAELLQVSWREQMKFSGNQAHFVGRVRAVIGNSVITCEELVVTLDQVVSLQQVDRAQKPKLTEVECRDHVRFEMQHYEESRLIGVRYLNVSTFKVNHVSGEMYAQGPGAMEFWQRRTGNSPLGLPEATLKKSDEADTKQPPTGWDYTRVTFADNLTGNIHRQLATLHDRVNVLHGPVDRPLVSFERDARPPRSVWMRCEDLEILLKQVPSDPHNKKANPWSLEIQAKQNAEIEGDQFRARADLISYDHQANLFVMRALENRHATFWYYEHPQAPRSRYDVKMVRFSPTGNILELDRTLGASGSR